MEKPPLPENPCLFVDADGTLLEFAEVPDAVVVGEEVGELLHDLPRVLGGAFAVISGRSISELDQIFGDTGFGASGIHGLEWRLPGGSIRVLEHQSGVSGPLFAKAERFALRHDGVLFENKAHGFALHFRRAPAAEGKVRDFMASLLPDGGQLEILEGNKVIELKVAGIDKGLAIERFMGYEPFVGRTPIFIGDDVTDEKGFFVVNAKGGVSIRVGTGDSCARYRLPHVAGVLDWLGSVRRALQ